MNSFFSSFTSVEVSQQIHVTLAVQFTLTTNAVDALSLQQVSFAGKMGSISSSASVGAGFLSLALLVISVRLFTYYFCR